MALDLCTLASQHRTDEVRVPPVSSAPTSFFP